MFDTQLALARSEEARDAAALTPSPRERRLLPGGVPRWVRLYDNGGETFDRYTAVYSGRYRKPGDWFFVRGMSRNPYHPQGFGVSDSYPYLIDAVNGKWPPAVGRRNHLGKRIRFEDLPADCQRCVLDDYRSLWGL